MTRVLFVCIGNSCRSPMAEGFARVLGAGLVEPSSAGLFPAAVIQPETFQVMAERGISLPDKTPCRITEVDGSAIDLLVNMSDLPAARFLRGFTGRELVWQIPDPIGQSLQIYRGSRDEIEKNVLALLAGLRSQASV